VYDQGRVQDILDTAIEAVMTGISTPEESMAAAQEEADAILSQYR